VKAEINSAHPQENEETQMKSTKISPVNVPARQTACLPTHYSLKPSAGRTHRSLLLAAILGLLLIPAAQQESQAQNFALAPVYVQLNAVQLDQLVAPIALDPDPLVAQILTASTFSDQVGDANNWLSQKMNLTPDQRATDANNMSWDPSVKGLIAFPAVLESLAKNTAWTTQLGNAYFNQPGDVMNAIQAMRWQAQQANLLVATPQEKVIVTADLIEIVPVNPAVVYVQYYNPWRIWGALFAAYPGYVLLPPPPGIVVADGVSFDPAVAVDAYAQFGWGFSAWSPAWTGGAVQFNDDTYVSNSRTVYNHGHFGCHDGGVFERGGHGVPTGYRAAAHAGAARESARSAFLGHSTSLPHRVPTPRPIAINHPGSAGHYAPANHPRPTNGTAGRRTANAGSNSVGHSTAAGRYNAKNRSNSTHSTVARNTPGARYGSNGRSTMPVHSASTNRSLVGNRAPGHSTASNRSMSQSRPLGASGSMGRPVSANRSFGGGQSTGRSSAAGRPFGANRPISRPASANRSFGGGQSLNRPASIGRSSGAGSSGNRMGGGRRR
jgi:hypothetical protein